MFKQKSLFIYEVFSIAIVFLALLFSWYFFNKFPDVVPTHWNITGEVDGWSSRFIGAFIIPLIITICYIVFLLLPKIDPRKERYEQFMRPYKIIQNIILAFLLILYLLTSFSILGWPISIAKVVPLMVGLLFIVLGNYFGKIKRNWFIGVKTPWTLSSEEIWNKTHRLSGKIFILGGFIFVFIPWLPVNLRMFLFIFVIILTTVLPIAYSYFLFRKNNEV